MGVPLRVLPYGLAKYQPGQKAIGGQVNGAFGQPQEVHSEERLAFSPGADQRQWRN